MKSWDEDLAQIARHNDRKGNYCPGRSNCWRASILPGDDVAGEAYRSCAVTEPQNRKGLNMRTALVTHRRGRISKMLGISCALVLGAAVVIISHSSSPAMPVGAGGSLDKIAIQDSPVAKVVVVRRGAAVGPRGGVYRGRTVVRRGPVVGRGPGVRRGAVVGRPVGRPWVRPARYWWRPGGAVAAGAALGVLTAASAAAWAGAPPAGGYCWYYTDPSRRQGFWDVCPR